MSTSDAESSSACAQTRVLVEHKGRGTARRAIRRAFLFDQASGLILEYQTVFIDLECDVNALNTHKAVLADLAFFYGWSHLRASRDQHWVAPERRAAHGQIALTDAEIRDLARWCHVNAKVLNLALLRQSEGKSRSVPSAGDPVSAKLRNRRLNTISRYVQWLTTSLAACPDTQDVDDAVTGEMHRRHLAREFEKRLSKTPMDSPPKSLRSDQALTLRKLLKDERLFPRSAHGIRDKLIFELLLQGLRAGEVLKTKVSDIDDGFEIDLGRRVGIVSVVRRPNEVDDIRIHEPAVKTLPGEVVIPRSLAQGLIEYARTWRRSAVDSRRGGKETPYLFVCQSGKTIGQPMSQRNLNRLVARLKGVLELPQSLAPHVLRHTHMTEVHDVAERKGHNASAIRDVLLQRGRWSPASTMPSHYTKRALIRATADLVEERDRQLAQDRS